MRLALILLFLATSALAADPPPCLNGKCPYAVPATPTPAPPVEPPPISVLMAPPPSPPPLSYEVWAYKLLDSKFVKQPALCIKSENLKTINDYLEHINAFFPDYVAVSNGPGSSQEGPMPQLRLPKDVVSPGIPVPAAQRDLGLQADRRQMGQARGPLFPIHLRD